ncbi:hypothetical protein L7F22_040396 [Adiantum nelumboides]|nr:hypothetical protein [Adiantum nelumboides]
MVNEFFYVGDFEGFGREATIQAQVYHPNVMPLVCCTRHPWERKCSLVMELMQLELQTFLIYNTDPTGTYPPFPLPNLMLQIAQGMDHLHSDKFLVIHRDLKSTNILVSFHANRVHLKLQTLECLRPILTAQDTPQDQQARLHGQL